MGLESFKDSLASLHNGKINVSVDLHKQAQYHTSWDWLMPVLIKCMQTGDDTDKWDHLYNVLSELNIDELYKAVVEFIKDHNLKQDKPLKLSGEMIEVPIEEETIFFWDDFNNSRKKK